MNGAECSIFATVSICENASFSWESEVWWLVPREVSGMAHGGSESTGKLNHILKYLKRINEHYAGECCNSSIALTFCLSISVFPFFMFVLHL